MYFNMKKKANEIVRWAIEPVDKKYLISPPGYINILSNSSAFHNAFGSMKLKSLFIAAIILLGFTAYGQGQNRHFEYTAKKLGVPIFNASIRISEGLSDAGKSLCQIQADVDSLSALKFLVRLNNRFTSTVEIETATPIRFVKEVDQQGLLVPKKNYSQTLTFDSNQKRVIVEKSGQKERKEIPLPPATYDPLSVFARYYLKEELPPGQEISMSIFDGLKLRQVVFRTKNERVKSELYGEVDAVCLESTTSFSNFGDQEGTVRIWYLAHGKKVPISIELDLPVGSVKFDLQRVVEG